MSHLEPTLEARWVSLCIWIVGAFRFLFSKDFVSMGGGVYSRPITTAATNANANVIAMAALKLRVTVMDLSPVTH